MFNICACKGGGRVLRRTWYLTEGVRPELRSRWIIEELPVAQQAEAARDCGESNEPVTEACDTETMPACA